MLFLWIPHETLLSRLHLLLILLYRLHHGRMSLSQGPGQDVSGLKRGSTTEPKRRQPLLLLLLLLSRSGRPRVCWRELFR